MVTTELKVPTGMADLVLRNYRGGVEKRDIDVRRIARALKRYTVIDVRQSIIAAGVNDEGWPRLAIARADRVSIDCLVGRDWLFLLPPDRSPWRRISDSLTMRFQRSELPGMRAWEVGQSNRVRSVTPLIPPKVRPGAQALHSYHVLFEANWNDVPDPDPMLLKRLSGDLFMVIAAWELTEIERAVLRGAVSRS